VSLADCGYYCDEDNDTHYTETLVTSCPSGRTNPTAGDDCDDDCSTCYPGSTAYTTSPDGLDQDCDGTIDEVSKAAEQLIYLYMAPENYSGNLGGRSGGDSKCDLGTVLYCASGKNRFFGSVNDSDEIRDMPSNYGYNTALPIYWYNRDSGVKTLLANDWADMLDGSIIASQYESTGVSSALASGSTRAGALSEYNCVGWTSSAYGEKGRCGKSTEVNFYWIYYHDYNCYESYFRPACLCEPGDAYQ